MLETQELQIATVEFCDLRMCVCVDTGGTLDGGLLF